MKQADLIKYYLIRNLLDKQTYVIPNYYLGNWECDVLELSKNNYTTEYEIKISKQDFKKDFDKQRVSHKVNGKWDWGNPVVCKNHDEILTGKRANRFYFVTPAGLLTKDDVPEYAGLIEIGDMWHDVKIIKHAKWLHKNIAGDKIYKGMMSKFYQRYVYNNYFPKFREFLTVLNTITKTNEK